MVGMAPPLLVVTPTKGHVGWDEPVHDPVVYLPHSGRSLAANLEPNQMTGLNETSTCTALAKDTCRPRANLKDAHPNTAGPVTRTLAPSNCSHLTEF